MSIAYWKNFRLDGEIVARCEAALKWGLTQKADPHGHTHAMESPWFSCQGLSNAECFMFRGLVLLARGCVQRAQMEFKSLEGLPHFITVQDGKSIGIRKIVAYMMIKHGSMPIEDLDLMMEYQEMTLGYLDLTRQQRNILLFGYPSIFTDGRSSDIKSDIPSDAKSDIKADPKNDTKASTTDTSSVAAAIAATAAAATATAAVAALPALATPLPAVVLQAPGPTTQLVLPVLTHGRSFTISNQCQQAVILTPSSEQDTKQSHGDNNPNPPKTTSSQCPANPFKPEIASDMWLNIMNHALQLSHMGRYRDSETHLRKMTQEYELSSGQLTGAYFNLALNVFLIGRNEKNNLLLDQALKLLDVPFVEGETADHPALLELRAEIQIELKNYNVALNALTAASQYRDTKEKSVLYRYPHFTIVKMRGQCWRALSELHRESNPLVALWYLLQAINCAKEEKLSRWFELQAQAMTHALAIEHSGMNTQESFVWLCVMMPQHQSVWKHYTESGMTLEFLSQKIKRNRNKFPDLSTSDVEVLEYHLQKLETRLAKPKESKLSAATEHTAPVVSGSEDNKQNNRMVPYHYKKQSENDGTEPTAPTMMSTVPAVSVLFPSGFLSPLIETDSKSE